ncbi:hypothetical protein ADUPG1_011002 [Aduncisulcus paluster]|uniref:Uncharacterized protein n=1 Tax=Aduncisulcus paluster TaxID=2918883 RepID=A0ABQ5JU66_9EUKA|nr:hypothetical protein ADUPG1_011002 [Aduncisulcus paluster]
MTSDFITHPPSWLRSLRPKSSRDKVPPNPDYFSKWNCRIMESDNPSIAELKIFCEIVKKSSAPEKEQHCYIFSERIGKIISSVVAQKPPLMFAVMQGAPLYREESQKVVIACEILSFLMLPTLKDGKNEFIDHIHRNWLLSDFFYPLTILETKGYPISKYLFSFCINYITYTKKRAKKAANGIIEGLSPLLARSFRRFETLSQSTRISVITLCSQAIIEYPCTKNSIADVIFPCLFHLLSQPLTCQDLGNVISMLSNLTSPIVFDVDDHREPIVGDYHICSRFDPQIVSSLHRLSVTRFRGANIKYAPTLPRLFAHLSCDKSVADSLVISINPLLRDWICYFSSHDDDSQGIVYCAQLLCAFCEQSPKFISDGSASRYASQIEALNSRRIVYCAQLLCAFCEQSPKFISDGSASRYASQIEALNSRRLGRFYFRFFTSVCHPKHAAIFEKKIDEMKKRHASEIRELQTQVLILQSVSCPYYPVQTDLSPISSEEEIIDVKDTDSNIDYTVSTSSAWEHYVSLRDIKRKERARKLFPSFYHDCSILDLHEWVPEETDELATKDDIFSFDRSFTARTGSFGGSIGRDGSVGLIDDGLNAVEDDGDFHMEWMNIQYDE